MLTTSKFPLQKEEIPQIPFSKKMPLFLALLKLRLSLLVAFSAGFGYLLGIKENINWVNFFALTFGGFLVSGASIVINQILEKDSDKLMNRTQKRPLPLAQISVQEAMIFGFLVALLGFGLLWIFTNQLTCFLSLISMLLYGFAYTPLKKVGTIAVWVGALPGALPPMLGWVAVSGEIDEKAMIIFLIQFVWQFPHFWAIAWVADEDYQKAGIKLLPSKGGKDTQTTLQIAFFTLLLIPLTCMPMYMGITGVTSAVVAGVAGFLFFLPTLQLIIHKDRKSALMIMFGSFIYLPIVQIAFLLDKI
jgi:heme o synthase